MTARAAGPMEHAGAFDLFDVLLGLRDGGARAH